METQQINSILSRAQLILTQPKSCWDVIAQGSADAKSIVISYALPLLCVQAVCQFLMTAVIGISTPFGTMRAPFFSSLVGQIVMLVIFTGAIFIMGRIVTIVAPKFGGRSDYNKAVGWLAYSQTASVLASVVALLPIIGFTSILALLYGVYVAFQGINRMTGVEGTNRFAFLLVLAVAGAVCIGIPVMIVTAIGLGATGTMPLPAM
jgi:hypothetical protein